MLLTKAWALEYAKWKIRVNCVCPGVVETDMTKPYLSTKSDRDIVAAEHPIGRIGAPEDVAKAIFVLCLRRLIMGYRSCLAFRWWCGCQIIILIKLIEPIPKSIRDAKEKEITENYNHVIYCLVCMCASSAHSSNTP